METKDLITIIIQSMVDYPEAVECDETHTKNMVILEVTLDDRDIGKVIGKRGCNATALRTLLKAIGGKHGIRYWLEIPQS